MNNIIVTDENGIPAASVDLDQVQAAGARLALRIAAVCGDPELVAGVQERAIAEHGEAYRYVVAAALQSLANEVLAPLLEVADELHRDGRIEQDLRAGLARIAAQEAGDQDG